MFQRPHREVPELNTTSTADISFMLLIFFLVTSSMDTDKGMPRQLPPAPDETRREELVVKERNVLELRIDEADRLTIGGMPATMDEVEERVARFVANTADASDLPEKSVRQVHLIGTTRVSDRHIISIQASSTTSFDAYFQMQNAIMRAYYRLRDACARQHFGHSYADCNAEQREAIALVYPQRISEQPLNDSPATASDSRTAATDGTQKGGSAL